MLCKPYQPPIVSRLQCCQPRIKTVGAVCVLVCALFLAGCQIMLDERNQEMRDGAAKSTAQPINNSGTVRIVGDVSYTSPYFYFDNPDPYITLYNISPFYGDQAPDSYEWIREGQQLGMIKTNPHASPFAYQLLLPALPSGPYVDLDRDAVDEAGVGIYTVNLVSNIAGDPFLDFAYGDSLSAMSSVDWGYDEALGDTIKSGMLVLYAPDNEQVFPIGFGPDELLFTEDDPLTTLSMGYTVVELNEEPFIFTRTATATVDIIEPESTARIDFTELGYVEAFDRLLDLMVLEYAYTDYYDVNWEQLDPIWRQQIVDAAANEDYDAYASTLYNFARTFSDGHISVEYKEFPLFIDSYDGSVGIVVQETIRGEVYVTDVIEDLPADNAGIRPGAQLLAINDTNPSEAISDTVPYYPSGLPSTVHWRLEQMKYVERGEIDSQIALRYRNPQAETEQTATLTRVRDWRAPYHNRFYHPDIPARPLPVEFDLLPSGYGHLKIYSFLDDKKLTLDLWNRAINTLIYEEISGVVLDMRQNEGGVMQLAELMASYFFDQNVALGAFTYYDAALDGFILEEENQRVMYPIPSELHYSGDIVLLIGPDCSSACEFFSYAVDQKKETQILGYYGSVGLGGAVESVYMPEGVVFSFTIGRAVDAEGTIHIEGRGVQPDVRVPVTREAVLASGDGLLRAAEIALDLAKLR